MRIVSFLLFFFLSSFAQAQISMEDFLAGVWDEPELQAFSNQNAYLNTNPYRLSMVRRLEFRTESNQLDPERQDYALRLNPANPWEVKRNNQYFKTYQEVLQLDQSRKVKESLLNRYQLIIQWAYWTELKKLKEDESRVNQNMIKILEAQRFSDYFDANDYVKLKLNQMEKIIEQEEIQFKIDDQRSRVEALLSKNQYATIGWTSDSLLEIERVEAVVDSIFNLGSGGNGEVAYREKKVMMANDEWLLEKSNVNVGFLQTEYQPFRTEQDRNPWSISLGVTIPVFNPNKGDMAKRKLDIIEAEGDLMRAKDAQESGRALMHAKIKTLISRYRNVKLQFEALKLDELGTSLQQQKGNPMATVRLENNVIKSNEITARLKQEIYGAYIGFLAYAELLQQGPLINYLSPSLQTLPAK